MPGEARIILLYGTDEYAITRRLAELASRFPDPSTAEMNIARLDARALTWDDLNNAVNALPFLATQRLIFLAHPSSKWTTPELRQKFLGFLEQVPETAVLVLWELAETQGWGTGGSRQDESKHWLAAWLRKKGLGVEYYAQPAAGDMPGWILRNAKSQKGEFQSAAAHKLSEMVGEDTRQAAQEVTKLLTYVDWKRAVTAADVEALTPFTAEANIWQLVEAVSSGNARVALALLHRYIEHDGEFYAWSMIIRQFRLILLAREVLDRGGGLAEAQKELRVGEYPAKNALKHARNFNLRSLERLYHRLLEIDEAAKTGRMPLDLGMELLISDLTT